jgi:hypothetical protein
MGGLLTKWPEKSGGVVQSWGNYALKSSSCDGSPIFNMRRLWMFPKSASSQAAYISQVNCAIPRLRELYAARNLLPIKTDAIYIHFRCSDVPFNYHSLFPMPRSEFLDYAMGVASERAPETKRVIIESCTHHAASRTGARTNIPNSEQNKIMCAKFARELRTYLQQTWPAYEFELACYSESESVRRMLGSRVLIMTIPSSFAFVTGAQKGKDFVTPKVLGVEPSWDSDRLHDAVPWSMYPGAPGTDVLTPVDVVPNYFQFDFGRFMTSRGAVASRGNDPWTDVRPQTDRLILLVIGVTLLALVTGLMLGFSITTFRRRRVIA